MPRPIAIFFHSVFIIDGQPLPNAVNIVHRQMSQLAQCGLLNACTELHVGVNGGEESRKYVDAYIPPKAKVTYHGTASRAENPTLVVLQEWVKTHPGWNVLYFHSKGATATPGSAKAANADEWRGTMMADLVTRWRQCVEFLATHDVVCSHWRWNAADGTQHIPAGNFLWTTSDFVATLPSLFLRSRIQQDGIGALSSRYEAEVMWGNGPRPTVKQFRPYAGSGIPLAAQVNHFPNHL